MANFIASKKEAKDFNNGVQYVNGDILQAESINNMVEGILYAQENGGGSGEGTSVDKKALVTQSTTIPIPSIDSPYIIYNENKAYVRKIYSNSRDVMYSPSSDCNYVYIVKITSISAGTSYKILWTKTEITEATGYPYSGSLPASGGTTNRAYIRLSNSYISEQSYNLNDAIDAVYRNATKYVDAGSELNYFSKSESGYKTSYPHFPFVRSNSSATVRYPSSVTGSSGNGSSNYLSQPANYEGTLEGLISSEYLSDVYDEIITKQTLAPFTEKKATATEYGSVVLSCSGQTLSQSGTNAGSAIPEHALLHKTFSTTTSGTVVDLNSFTSSGHYQIQSIENGSLKNFPTEVRTGYCYLEVRRMSSSKIQQTLYVGDDNTVWERWSISASTWGEWKQNNLTDNPATRQFPLQTSVMDGADINTLINSGIYFLRGRSDSALRNAPMSTNNKSADGDWCIMVFHQETDDLITQIAISLRQDRAMYLRNYNGSSWNSWYIITSS